MSTEIKIYDKPEDKIVLSNADFSELADDANGFIDVKDIQSLSAEKLARLRLEITNMKLSDETKVWLQNLLAEVEKNPVASSVESPKIVPVPVSTKKKYEEKNILELKTSGNGGKIDVTQRAESARTAAGTWLTKSKNSWDEFGWGDEYENEFRRSLTSTFAKYTPLFAINGLDSTKNIINYSNTDINGMINSLEQQANSNDPYIEIGGKRIPCTLEEKKKIVNDILVDFNNSIRDEADSGVWDIGMAIGAGIVFVFMWAMAKKLYHKAVWAKGFVDDVRWMLSRGKNFFEARKTRKAAILGAQSNTPSSMIPETTVVSEVPKSPVELARQKAILTAMFEQDKITQYQVADNLYNIHSTEPGYVWIDRMEFREGVRNPSSFARDTALFEKLNADYVARLKKIPWASAEPTFETYKFSVLTEWMDRKNKFDYDNRLKEMMIIEEKLKTPMSNAKKEKLEAKNKKIISGEYSPWLWVKEKLKAVTWHGNAVADKNSLSIEMLDDIMRTMYLEGAADPEKIKIFRKLLSNATTTVEQVKSSYDALGPNERELLKAEKDSRVTHLEGEIKGKKGAEISKAKTVAEVKEAYEKATDGSLSLTDTEKTNLRTQADAKIIELEGVVKADIKERVSKAKTAEEVKVIVTEAKNPSLNFTSVELDALKVDVDARIALITTEKVEAAKKAISIATNKIEVKGEYEKAIALQDATDIQKAELLTAKKTMDTKLDHQAFSRAKTAIEAATEKAEVQRIFTEANALTEITDVQRTELLTKNREKIAEIDAIEKAVAAEKVTLEKAAAEAATAKEVKLAEIHAKGTTAAAKATAAGKSGSWVNLTVNTGAPVAPTVTPITTPKGSPKKIDITDVKDLSRVWDTKAQVIQDLMEIAWWKEKNVAKVLETMYLKLGSDPAYSCSAEISKLEGIFGDAAKTGILVDDWKVIAKDEALYTRVIRDVAMRPKLKTPEYKTKSVEVTERIKMWAGETSEWILAKFFRSLVENIKKPK